MVSFLLALFWVYPNKISLLKVFLSNSVVQTIWRDYEEFWLGGFPAVEVVERFRGKNLSLVCLKSLIYFYYMSDCLRFLSDCCSCLEGVWNTHSMAWVVWHEDHLINNHQCVRRTQYFCCRTIGSFSFIFMKWLLYKLSFKKVLYLTKFLLERKIFTKLDFTLY